LCIRGYRCGREVGALSVSAAKLFLVGFNRASAAPAGLPLPLLVGRGVVTSCTAVGAIPLQVLSEGRQLYAFFSISVRLANCEITDDKDNTWSSGNSSRVSRVTYPLSVLTGGWFSGQLSTLTTVMANTSSASR